MTDLKPCPFCGGVDFVCSSNGMYNYFVSCDGCGVEGPASVDDDSAMTEWDIRAQDQWIPVGERWPEDGLEVLFLMPTTGIKSGYCYEGEPFHVAPKDIAITHWQPLPPPPKENK